MKNSFRHNARYLAASSLLAVAVASPAHAQLTPPAPVRAAIDGNGVNLFDGKLHLNGPALTMGQGEPQGLSFYKLNRGTGWSDNVTAALNLAGSTMTVSLGGYTDRFTVSGSTYTPTEGNGATLTYNSTTGIYTYTRSDGTVVRFDKAKATLSPYYSNEGRALDIVSPSGAKLVFSYASLTYCDNYKAGSGGYICMHTGNAYRLSSVRSSYGYKLTFNYAAYEYMYDPTEPQTQPDFAAWSKLVGVTATNLAVASGASTPSQSFAQTSSGGNSYFQVTDPMGRVTKYRYGAGGVAGVTLPGSSSEDMTFGYTSGRVTSVATPAGTTGYAASDLNGTRTVIVTDPLNHVTTYKFDIASERMTEVTDDDGHTTRMQYDANGRLTKTTAPENNYVQLTYDARGNVTERRVVPKSGTGPNDIVTTARFPDNCANIVTCNQPEWTKDAKGNQTDYTYDPVHGGVLTVTAPPAPNGIRPQIRYSYSSLQAYFKNSSGSIVASGEPVTLLTGIAACQTLNSCTGTADEVKSTVSYGPQIAGIGNNLLPVSVSAGAANEAQPATVSYTYDDVGNRTYIDGPLGGITDTSRAIYNANREQIGSISPDPDGGGTLPNRAARITIDSRGLVTKHEQGTTAGQSDAAWAGFLAYTASDIFYDSSRRPYAQSLSGGGVTQAMTQVSYDAAGRVDCVATRMNPAVYGSLPASACTQGTTGSFGPDRITKTIYNDINQPIQQQVAVGTGDVANEVTLTYTGNGKLATLKDGENNLTTYIYDGFDRLSQTQFPNAAKGSGTSNVSDYEQLTYDANSNLYTRQIRSGELIEYRYDALNRLILKGGALADINYSYDNFGRLLTAKFATAGIGITNSYDALGRLTSSSSDLSGSLQATSYQYDLAGRRTRLTYPGGTFYVDYDYLVTGEMTRIRENGATSGIGVLATFAYDNLGRRSSLTFGNGASQQYSFDAVSRLSSLTANLAGTSNDLNIGSIAYNPASQILSTVRSNDAYSWTGSVALNRGYTSNGLNQYTAAGPASFTYTDNRGNLTSDGTVTYGYTSENQLTSISGGLNASLSYDPAMRLYQVTSGPTTTRFAYDGLDMIAEYSGSNQLQRRFVHGPDMDEPLVQYEGSDTATRRFLHADERGSIVAISDASGNRFAANSYDEYGIPGSSNYGRFQYTGQIWMPEIGLYHYKARAYSASLGRFLQTDPISVAGGVNLYGYVANDPVNLVDPLGLKSKLPPPTCPFEEICVIGDRPEPEPEDPLGSDCGWECTGGPFDPSPGSAPPIIIEPGECLAGDTGCEGGTIVVPGTKPKPPVKVARNGLGNGPIYTNPINDKYYYDPLRHAREQFEEKVRETAKTHKLCSSFQRTLAIDWHGVQLAADLGEGVGSRLAGPLGGIAGGLFTGFLTAGAMDTKAYLKCMGL